MVLAHTGQVTLAPRAWPPSLVSSSRTLPHSDLGGETAAVMGELLATRADMLAIHVTYNSLSTTATAGGGKSDAARGAGGARTNRASLFPSLGHLYPNGTDALTRVEDEDGLRRALGRAWPEYAALWDEAPVDAVSWA